MPSQTLDKMNTVTFSPLLVSTLPDMEERLTTWIEALESDAYRQATGYLRLIPFDDGKARCCCLGVACMIFGNQDLWQEGDYHFKYGSITSYPPPAEMNEWFNSDERGQLLVEWAKALGYKDLPMVKGSEEVANLGYANDELEGWTFARIAKLLTAVRDGIRTAQEELNQ